MRTTCAGHAKYVGADLTDAYARKPRAIDVCGLDAVGTVLGARFWQWTHEGGIDDIAALLPEIRAARGVVLDGPQALAKPGASMRECERILGAAGKTPSTPPATGPFAGFVRTSVEFFAAFDRVPVAVSPASLAGAVGEHYPGGNWRRLTTPLPSKKFPAGVAARRAILEALRVRFPADLRLTDDHLDACLGAVIAAAADGAIPGARVERCGAEIARDGARLREGPILVLRVDDATTARLAEAVRKVAPALPEPAPNGERAAKSPPPGLVRVGVTSRLLDSTQDAIAVEGLSHLNAKKEVRRRIGLPDYGGHLWLGDHGCFWAKHQLEDPVAIETYKRVRESLVFSPDDYDDVEAIIDDTTAHP